MKPEMQGALQGSPVNKLLGQDTLFDRAQRRQAAEEARAAELRKLMDDQIAKAFSSMAFRKAAMAAVEHSSQTVRLNHIHPRSKREAMRRQLEGK